MSRRASEVAAPAVHHAPAMHHAPVMLATLAMRHAPAVLATLAALAALAGCGNGGNGAARNIDVCAVEPGVAGALTGGQLRLGVQAADGTPVVSESAASDRPSAHGLAGAVAGDLVVVEGLDGGGALVALGSVTLAETGGCVCLARRAWRATGVWSDAGGAHFGPHSGFFVGTPPPGLVPQTLKLDRGVMAAGDQPVASFTFVNSAASTLAVRALTLFARPPGAGHDSARLKAFNSSLVTPLQLGPGAKLVGQATGLFSDGDPSGVWALFTRYVDALGVPHDGPELEFLVRAGTDPLAVQIPLELSPLWVAAGQSLHGYVVLQNRGTATVTVTAGQVTARAPGDDDAGGLAYDFGNIQKGPVAPGMTLALPGDRLFGVAEDPCAGVVCRVENGQCRFAVAP
jgi:hypothetical protein